MIIDYIKNLRFTEEDIEFLRTKNLFSEDFLEYLRGFKFTGDIWAVPEGTAVFPNEPLMVVRAKAIELGMHMVVESETLQPDGISEVTRCFNYLKTLEK